MIIDNIIISITYYNYDTGFIEVMLFEPTSEKFINTYTNSENDITYMYNISNIDILKMNNIYNKKEVDKYYNTTVDATEYYLPEDVVHIINNKKIINF
jgi:hypothetical protein